MNTLASLLQHEDAAAQTLSNGVTVRVEQYINPFTHQPFWLFYDVADLPRVAESAENLDLIHLTFDYEYLSEEVFGLFDADVDAPVWERVEKERMTTP